MDHASVNGIALEYEVSGSGEPVLLIGTGPLADSFLPLTREVALAERYRLIRYHQRGQAGSSHGPAPVSFAVHAADAAALLRHLGISRAHVAGHSTGASIALQLAADHPGLVHSLVLLEPPLLSVPNAGPFFEEVGPALAAYASGDRAGAMAAFLSAVSGLDSDTCRTVIEKRIPGGVAEAIQDADTFFGSYLPALQSWRFGPEQATAIAQPVLSVVGTNTKRLFLDGHQLLHSWLPQLEDCTVEGVAHLLHVEQPRPVAHGMADFFARRPIQGTGTRTPVELEASGLVRQA
jgi:pimeloyl-ACP methyl ester carboxylesterase